VSREACPGSSSTIPFLCLQSDNSKGEQSRGGRRLGDWRLYGTGLFLKIFVQSLDEGWLTHMPEVSVMHDHQLQMGQVHYSAQILTVNAYLLTKSRSR
jgi:hypothetical protein